MQVPAAYFQDAGGPAATEVRHTTPGIVFLQRYRELVESEEAARYLEHPPGGSVDQ